MAKVLANQLRGPPSPRRERTIVVGEPGAFPARLRVAEQEHAPHKLVEPIADAYGLAVVLIPYGPALRGSPSPRSIRRALVERSRRPRRSSMPDTGRHLGNLPKRSRIWR